MDYTPARSREPIEVSRTGCRLGVLRSHHAFPNTLSPELEGLLVDVQHSVTKMLAELDPPCHTNWEEFNPDEEEERDGRYAAVIYVMPGPAPVRPPASKPYEVVRL